MRRARMNAAFLIGICLAFSSPLLAQKTSPSCQETMDAAAWVVTSTEWQMNCMQAWKLAERQLELALADQSWTAAIEQQDATKGQPLPKSPAVILDIDETVLNNVAFQETLILEDIQFSDPLWDEWIATRSATEIPGALSFIKRAHELGVKVFYVSNRTCLPRAGTNDTCSQKTDTIANLVALGFPKPEAEDILLKKQEPEWGSEKSPRRQLVAENHRILLQIGDDLGDFMPHVKGEGVTAEKRLQMSRKYQDWWGTRWIALPNPMYGSWMRVLNKDKKSHFKGFR